MIRLSHAPLHDWHRGMPTAKRIANELLRDRAVLNLRSRLLVSDIRGRFQVSSSTAYAAVSIARKAS